MLDEALHAAQTLRQREQMAALEHAARALEPAAQYRGDDTAETTRHLSPGKRVLRVTRQPRVVHALDPGMLLQELRDGERIGAMSLHAQRQGLDAPQGEERVEGAGYGAHRVLQIGDALGELRVRPHDRSSPDGVGMSIEILGRRVHADIEAMLERALNERRR